MLPTTNPSPTSPPPGLESLLVALREGGQPLGRLADLPPVFSANPSTAQPHSDFQSQILQALGGQNG